MNDELLEGWGSIAAYVGRSVRGAQRWERDLGLPIRRKQGPGRPVVYVFRTEVDAWLRGDNLPDLDNDGDPPASDLLAGASSLPPRASQGRGKTEQTSAIRWRAWFLFGFVVVVGALFFGTVGYQRDSSEVTSLQYSTDPGGIGNGRAVTLLRNDESPHTTLRFKNDVSTATLVRSSALEEPALIVGLADGARERQGHLLVTGLDGTELWSFDPFDAEVMAEARDRFGDHSTYLRFTDIHVPRTHETPLVVAVAQSQEFFVSRILALNLETGELIGDYWHAGKIGYARSAMDDIDGDGFDEIVVSGFNNALWGHWAVEFGQVPVVFTFDVEWLQGTRQSWPPRFTEIPVAAPAWCYFFPARDGEVGTISELRLEDQNRDGILDVRVSTAESRFHFFKGDGTSLPPTAAHSWTAKYGLEIPAPILLGPFELALDHFRRRDLRRARESIENVAAASGHDAQLWLRRISEVEQLSSPGEAGFVLRGLWDPDAVVGSVLPGGPADLAGLRRGDQILLMNEERVDHGTDVLYQVRRKEPGEVVNLVVLREGKRLRLRLVIAEASLARLRPSVPVI